MTSASEAGTSPRDAAAAAVPVWTKPETVLAAVMAVAAIVYLRSLGNGFVFDDRELIVQNPYIRQWSFLWKSFVRDMWWFRGPAHLPQSSYYRPLEAVWVSLHYHLFGLSPAGWHATAILLHLISVWLVFKIAAGLTRDSWTAVLAGALFALIPIQAEAVVWPSAISHDLSAAFQLGAFYFLMRSIGRRRMGPAAIVLYAGALLSHESAAVFPAIVACFTFFLCEGESAAGFSRDDIAVRLRRAALWAAPFAIEVVIYLIVRKLVLGFVLTNPASAINNATAAQVLMTMPRVLAEYLMLLAVPWLAGPAHRVIFVTSAASPDFYVSVFALAIAGAVFLFAISNHTRRGLYAFLGAWIAIAIVPSLNLFAFPRDQLVHDNYVYLASVGWSVLVADWAVRLARRSDFATRTVWAGAAAVTMANVAVLWNVERFWRNDIALYGKCIAAFPDSWHCHYNLGLTLSEIGDLPGAERQLQAAIRVLPDVPGAHYALGQVFARSGRPRDAVTEFEASLKLSPRPPANGYVSLAEAYESEGDLAAAERELNKALELYPNDGKALYALGLLHEHLGRTSKAAAEIVAALRFMPDAPATAYINLAELYDAQGNLSQSEAVLQKVESMPDGAEAAGIARARIRARHGDRAAAEKILRDLTGRFPNDRAVWTLLGLLMQDENRNDDALAAFRRVLAIAPRDAESHLLVARSLHASGRDREALDQCRQALAIDPGNAKARVLIAEIPAAAGSR